MKTSEKVATAETSVCQWSYESCVLECTYCCPHQMLI